MTDLKTKYMGLELRNPLIVASSGLTSSIDHVERCADAGAGAVVLKSIFEEQIRAESAGTEPDSWLQWHPEAFDYVSNLTFELGSRQYLTLIEKAKKKISVPVIASLNCIAPKWWVDYAGHIESAGADGLEMNVAFMPSDPVHDPAEVEKQAASIVKGVLEHVKIPVAVKIGPFYTSVARLAADLDGAGASALVLFNRFYRFDIDVDTMNLKAGYRFSSPEEISLPLRWISLLSGRVKCDLASSTGVHDAEGAIKQLLAGATAVQLCSTLYINGLERIRLILDGIEAWMAKHGFNAVPDFRGRLSQMKSDRPELYERLQYIKSLVGIE